MVGREEWRDFGGCWYHILSSPDSHIKTNAENPKKIEKGAKLQVLRPKGYKKKKKKYKWSNNGSKGQNIKKP